MSKKTYTGSCHCQRVRYEVDLDLSKGTGRCNCSICWKLRNWGAIAKPEDFRLLSGEDALTDYTKSESAHHLFCKYCGVHSFGRGNVPQIGGEYVGIRLNCLDDVTPDELIAAPLRYQNGRDNLWWEEPKETRHL